MNNNPQVQGHFVPILYTGYPQGRGSFEHMFCEVHHIKTVSNSEIGFDFVRGMW